MIEMKAGYKQTELGVIPEDWEVRKIKSVCILINGRGFKPFEWQKTGLPIIRIQNLNGSDDFNYYQGSYNKKLEVEPGHLLFAWSGSRGTSFGPYMWKGSSGLLNYHTWKVQVSKSEIDKDFFFHALKKLTTFIEDKAHGASALVHTQKWEMESFEFPIPPTKTEQTAIATVLSDTDALIERLEKLIAKKKAIKQGTMQQLLTGKKRLPGFEIKKGYKQTELGVMPEDWEIKEIGNISDVDPDNLGSSTNPDYAFKYISLEDVDCGILRNYAELMFKNAPSRARRKIQHGDILISTVRPNLKSHLLVRDQVRDFICSTGFSVVRCKDCNTNSEYIFNHFLASIINKQIDNLITGSNYPAISSKDVKALLIPIPPSIEEQNAIATILSDMDAEIEALEQTLDKYTMIKQGMMQQLLTGRIRIHGTN